MFQNTRHYFFTGVVRALATMAALILLGTVSAATTNAQSTAKSAHGSATQQPLYSNYRGVSIGMTAQEVRTTLGAPLNKADDMDLYAFSDTETAQIVYDAALKVKVVSVDYVGGVGAPDYKLVVGADLQLTANGSNYKLVRYETLGFWVSYNRSANEVPIVTITITKM